MEHKNFQPSDQLETPTVAHGVQPRHSLDPRLHPNPIVENVEFAEPVQVGPGYRSTEAGCCTDGLLPAKLPLNVRRSGKPSLFRQMQLLSEPSLSSF